MCVCARTRACGTSWYCNFSGLSTDTNRYFICLQALNRVKRVTAKDMLFVMENDRWLRRSTVLYRATNRHK